MGHYVNASELAAICLTLQLEAEEQALVEASENAADAIANKLGVKCDSVATEPQWGGLCADFQPAFAGQGCPDELRGLDSSSDWAIGKAED